MIQVEMTCPQCKHITVVEAKDSEAALQLIALSAKTLCDECWENSAAARYDSVGISKTLIARAVASFNAVWPGDSYDKYRRARRLLKIF